jgi:hypothetical protein
MDRLKRGFIFLIQAGRIARKSPITLQPLAYYLGAGVLGALLIACLIALSLARLGAAGAVLAGFLAALLLAVLLLAGYLASVESGRRVFEILSPEADPGAGSAWSAVRLHWLDLSAVAVTTPWIGLLRLLLGRKSGSFLAAPWTQAVGLVSSSMAVEGLDLKKGLERAGQMVCDNLLIMQPGQVAAGWAGTLAGLPIAAGGILLGWGLGRGIALSTWSLPHKNAAGLVVGMVIASALVLIAVAETVYSSAAYRACLFSWARAIETRRGAGTQTNLEPPAPLAIALTGLESLTAPVYSGSNQTNEG